MSGPWGQYGVFLCYIASYTPYYKELLSGSQEEYAVYAKSPFKAENRLVLAASDVSSRYSRRGKSQYERISDYIESIIKGRTGNYILFFRPIQLWSSAGDS